MIEKGNLYLDSSVKKESLEYGWSRLFIRCGWMKWIFLIGDDKFTINSLKMLPYDGCISIYEVSGINERLCVDYGDDHVFYDVIDDTSDFDEYIRTIPFRNPVIIMMTYTSSYKVVDILKQKDFPKDIYVDNDLGVVVPIQTFVDMGMPMS